MYDRISRNPGRVLITPENGSGAFYATLTMADNPTVAGTPLNKANLLSDATAALYGLSGSAVPDDVLEKARSLITTAQNTANNANTGLSSAFRWKQIGSLSIDFSGADTKYYTMPLNASIINFSDFILELNVNVTGQYYVNLTVLTASGASGPASEAIYVEERSQLNSWYQFAVPRTEAQAKEVIQAYSGNQLYYSTSSVRLFRLQGLTSLTNLYFAVDPASTTTASIQIAAYGRGSRA